MARGRPLGEIAKFSAGQTHDPHCELRSAPGHPGWIDRFHAPFDSLIRLVRASSVRLRIYDLVGRAVRTLVDRPFQTPGSYSVAWTAETMLGAACEAASTTTGSTGTTAPIRGV